MPSIPAFYLITQSASSIIRRRLFACDYNGLIRFDMHYEFALGNAASLK